MALVQSKTYGSTASSASHSVTLDASPTTGNLLVLVVVGDSTVSATPSGWSVATSAVDGTGSYVYYRVASAGLSATISITLSGSTSCVLLAFEYSGYTATPLDKVASAVGQGPSTISTGTTVATTQANELLFAMVGISLSAGHTGDVSSWSNSFVQLGNAVSSGSTVNVRGAAAALSVAVTGTYTTTASITTLLTPPGANNSGIIATFKLNPATAYTLAFSARMCEFNVQRLA
jgi:hypothetical protein